jgi:hypothetical protein
MSTEEEDFSSFHEQKEVPQVTKIMVPVELELNAVSIWRRSGNVWSNGDRLITFIAKQWANNVGLPMPEAIKTIAPREGGGAFNVINMYFSQSDDERVGQPTPRFPLTTLSNVLKSAAHLNFGLNMICGRQVSIEPMKRTKGSTRDRDVPTEDVNFLCNMFQMKLISGEPFETKDRFMQSLITTKQFVQKFTPIQSFISVQIEGRDGHHVPRIIFEVPPFNSQADLLNYLANIRCSTDPSIICTMPLAGRLFSIEPIPERKRSRSPKGR